MGVISTGQTFSSGDQVTSTKLNDIANQATFTSAAETTDNSTLTVSGGKLKVANDGIGSTQLATDAVEEINIKDGAVTPSKLSTSALSTLLPVGSVLPYAGALGAPAGFHLCDGSAYSRTTYATLFAALGGAASPYGLPDASTFNVPDLRGRVIAGMDDMGGSSANRLTGLAGGVDGDVLGATGGDEKHILATSELPAHDHDVTVAFKNNSVNGIQGNYPAGTDISSPSPSQLGSNTVSIENTGGGGGHNNVQPTFILNYIIKA